MGQFHQGFPLLAAEKAFWNLRSRLPQLEALDAELVEVVDHVAHRLGTAVEIRTDLPGHGYIDGLDFEAFDPLYDLVDAGGVGWTSDTGRLPPKPCLG